MPETKSFFERYCRLCAEEQDVTIKIFSAEAEAILLQKKLIKYLLIEVDQNDKLPKNICINCCTKLQTVCEFIDKAHEAQKILILHSTALEEPEIGNNDTTFKSEPDYCNTGSKTTNMEINVDPVMMLQNSDGEPLSIDDNVLVQDVTHLHGVDYENVTIKLIKNGEIKPSDENCNKLFPCKTYKKQKSSDTDDNQNKPFPCETCKRGFFTELALKNHSWIHSTEKTDDLYTCNTCSKVFKLKFEYLIHLKIHKEKTGVCKLCGRIFRAERTYKAHMAAHAGINNLFTCKECGQSFKTWGNLRSHSITHSSERPYICNFCQKSFKRKQDLKFHINQHTGARPYKCPFCDKGFASYGNCYSHKNRIHPGKCNESKIKIWAGTPNENQLQSRSITKSHLTNVRGVYKYKCQLCDHSFMRRDNYTYHMYKHTGVKPFQCSFCTEKFITRKGLLLHHDKEHPMEDRPLALLSKNVLLK